MAITDRFKKAWNAFRSQSENSASTEPYEISYYGGSPPTRSRPKYVNERTIITSIYNLISIDVSSIAFRHVILDSKKRYKEDKNSLLNRALTLEPNLDQSPRAFRQDICMTLFENGVAVVVPTDSVRDDRTEEDLDYVSFRVGTVTGWYPSKVKVEVYNESTGQRQEIIIEKSRVAIIENPLYSVMNAPNSTLQRLIRKLSLLDAVDEASSSGKLDLIIQLPYTIKSEARRQQAEKRREDIEFQLKSSQYGIAYTDGTEKITQLNRPAENNLMTQIEFLVGMLYSQLGITEEVMNSTASESVMTNYTNRTVEPIVDAIREAMQRSFINSAKSDEAILYFRDPFRLVSISNVADLADKLTRNEIMTSNEFRGILGLPPALDPKADELRNSNMPSPGAPSGVSLTDLDSLMNDVFSDLDKEIEGLTSSQTGSLE